jgi:hypothetical protein
MVTYTAKKIKIHAASNNKSVKINKVKVRQGKGWLLLLKRVYK